MADRFEIIATALEGLYVLQRQLLQDERGYLERLFCQDELTGMLLDKPVVQINHTLTNSIGALRGLHFQYPPHAETKMVSCLRGEVFDVAVDVRTDSPTFLQWHGEVLSAQNYRTLLIPEGFAHGFQTLTNHCEMLYFHTAAYTREAEGGLNALDPVLSIAWPLAIREQSVRDQQHPMLTADFQGIRL